MLYELAVDAVDGVRSYIIFSPSALEVLGFLSQHDHEGSSLMLRLFKDNFAADPDEFDHDPERIYEFLTAEGGREDGIV